MYFTTFLALHGFLLGRKMFRYSDALPYQVKTALNDFHLKFLVFFLFFSNLGSKCLSCIYKLMQEYAHRTKNDEICEIIVRICVKFKCFSAESGI